MSESIGKVQLESLYRSGEDRRIDRDEAEDRILELVSCYQEREYPRILTENPSWPILLHLSPLRESLMNWIPFRVGQRILEIGSGCGAVTGAFLHKGLEVTCVEPSLQKSRINATRHEDCGELRILVGEAWEILPRLEERFDHVTLIGWPEQATAGCGAEEALRTALRSILPVLKDDGVLWTATGNRLGMKYFAGCKEDYTGEYFEGICGYPHGGEAQTWSRKELIRLAGKGGYRCNFYYPYPDWQFPVKIFSDEYLPRRGELNRNWQTFSADRLKLFDESRAYDSVIEAGMFPEMSNAFLIEMRKKVAE